MSRISMLSIAGMLVCLVAQAALLRRPIQRKLTFETPEESIVGAMQACSLGTAYAQKPSAYGPIRRQRPSITDCIKQLEQLDLVETFQKHLDILDAIKHVDDTNVEACMTSLLYVLMHKKSFALPQILHISTLSRMTLAVAKSTLYSQKSIAKLTELYHQFMQKNIVLI